MAVNYSINTTPTRLDPKSVAYLKAIEETGGLGQPGIFIKGGVATGGPRSGWLFFGILALLLTGVAALLCVDAAHSDVGDQSPVKLRAAMAGLGAFLLLISIIRFRRILPPWLPRSFTYADANFVWDVLPGRIKTTALSTLASASATEYTKNGAYSHTSIKLTFVGAGTSPNGLWSFSVYRRKEAQVLMKFFQYLVAIRTSDQPEIREFAKFPGLLGNAARGLAEGKSLGQAIIGEAIDPPTPHVVEPDPSIPLYESWKPALFSMLCGIVVGLLSVTAFARVDSYFQDEMLYATAKQDTDSDVRYMDKYLAAFPHGRHAAEILALRDDRLFVQAQALSDQEASPGGLRGYLADASNVRHRAAAWGMIAKYYDQAIADLKAKQASADSKVDPQLLQGIVALLEGLKSADRPVVTVGFRSDVDAEPQSQEARDHEGIAYQQEQTDHPELKTIAASAPGKTAIIPPTHVFDAEQMKSREAMIMGRLQDVVQKGIKADILTLEPAPPGTRPSMEVYYHITDDGSLGLYTSTQEDHTDKVVGLLRWYGIDWKIAFHPNGSKNSFEYSLSSQPGSSLHYAAQDSDPDWAIYAVVLYSGFYDMSAQLVKGFGQDPGPEPDKFSFTDAEGQYQPDQTSTLPTPSPDLPNLPDLGGN